MPSVHWVHHTPVFLNLKIIPCSLFEYLIGPFAVFVKPLWLLKIKDDSVHGYMHYTYLTVRQGRQAELCLTWTWKVHPVAAGRWLLSVAF